MPAAEDSGQFRFGTKAAPTAATLELPNKRGANEGKRGTTSSWAYRQYPNP
jgi:hypothetical protein